MIWLAKIMRCIIWWGKPRIYMSLPLLLSQNRQLVIKKIIKGANHFKVHSIESFIWSFDRFTLVVAKLYYIKVQRPQKIKQGKKKFASGNIYLRNAHNHFFASWASKTKLYSPNDNTLYPTFEYLSGLSLQHEPS